jgi:DNA mismatch repair protein MutS
MEADSERSLQVHEAATAQLSNVQMSIFQLDDPVLEQVREQILDLDINNITPVDALMKLSEIQRVVSGISKESGDSE